MRKNTWRVLRPVAKGWAAAWDIINPVLFFVFSSAFLQVWMYWRGGMTLYDLVKTPEYAIIGLVFPVIYIAFLAWHFKRSRKAEVVFSQDSIDAITKHLTDSVTEANKPLCDSINTLISEIRGERNERIRTAGKDHFDSVL